MEFFEEEKESELRGVVRGWKRGTVPRIWQGREKRCLGG